jgi:hypothetical protein
MMISPSLFATRGLGEQGASAMVELLAGRGPSSGPTVPVWGQQKQVSVCSGRRCGIN